MRSDVWSLLGIEPTDDRKAIRSAYAAQSRLHHPEEEPEYFVELNQAYRQALALARTANGDDGGELRKLGTVREEKRGPGNRRDTEEPQSGDDRREERVETVREEKRGPGNRRDTEEPQSGDDRTEERSETGREEKRGRGNRRDTEEPQSGDDRTEESSEDIEAREDRESREESGNRRESATLLERLAGAQQKAIQASMETGALRDLITLFTDSKQAKAADAWRRFFLSEAFLGEQYTEEFARGLSDYLMEQEVFPWDNLPMALLQELAIAYGLIPHFAGEEYREGMKYPKEWYKVSVEQTFPARKQVAEIFNRQGWDCDLKSMTRRMLKQPANKVRHNAFSDYLALKEMGRRGQLTEAEKETWQYILGFGQVHYLFERNGKRPGTGDYESRSECVVKLYVQWLKEERLPECVLKFLYRKFSFRELDRSSTRGLYGALKEQVLRQLPQVEELLFDQDGLEQKVTKVYRICSAIINDNHSDYEKSIYEETPQIRERVEALFAMPEWREVQGDRGLFDRLYGGAKRLVMPRSLAEGLIRCLQQGDFPEPKRTELLESLLRSLATGQMCREIDYRFQLSFPAADREDLGENGDFWQYYLMRGYGFRHSRIRGDWEEGYLYEMDRECYLPAYIRYLYMPSRAWQRAFTGFCEETESIAAPVSAVCALPDGRCLRVEFHYHYCLYFVEEEPVLYPVLSFDELRRWASERSQGETYIGRVQDFFFLLAVTAIESSERREAETLIGQWLVRLPLHAWICPLLARLLAADNDRLPEGTTAVYYEEQERFCFRAVVSGEDVRIYRQMEFGWEDRIFRKAEFGWKEVPLSLESLWQGRSPAWASNPGEEAKRVGEALLSLRQPKPAPLAFWSLDGMDPQQKVQAVLRCMGFPETAEGYCVLRYGQERRHDKVFYGARSPYGFPIAVHSTEYERTMQFHMDVSRTKIKEKKRYVGRFGWGFKYLAQSDYGPLCVYQGESGMYYADGAVKTYRADSLDKLLADCLGSEFEGVTQVEIYGGILTVSGLDHRLEYCYGEADFQASVHGREQTVADFFTVFGGYRLWETFGQWMDNALEKGLPERVNLLTIEQVLGNEEREGSVLALTACHVEELNLDLMEQQERLEAEDFREEDRWEEPDGEQEEQQDLQTALVSAYEEYSLEAPCLVWGKGFAVPIQRQSLVDATRWYLEERPGEGARLLQNRRIRVEIADRAAADRAAAGREIAD